MRYSILTVALIATAALLPKFALAQAGPYLSIPENDLRFATQLRGGVYLGVQLADITADRARALKLDEERGVEVVKVEPGSPAESAGIKAADVLLSYNAENILGAQQLGRLVSETPEGRKVKIQLWRDGRMQTVYAVIAEAHWPRVFPGADLNIQMPDIRVAMPDIPNTLLVWKNSLGMECEPVDAQLAEYFGVKRGVLVRSVEKGSAADKAGLKAGDVLTAIGDRSVTSPREVMSCVRAGRREGKPITVAVTRDRRQLTLSVTPEPEESGITLEPPR
jgi:serine protease Do